jgi:hypothetical protein
VNVVSLGLQTEVTANKVRASSINLDAEIVIPKVNIVSLGLQVEVIDPGPVDNPMIQVDLIKILDSNLKRLAIVKSVISAKRMEELNGENTLDFTVVMNSKYDSLITETSVFELNEDYFDIASFKKNLNEDDTMTIEVESDHVSYRLNNPDFDMEYFTVLGTPTEILTEILDGTGFTVGQVDFIQEQTYSAQEPKSRRQLVMEFAAYVGGELIFNQFTVSIVSHRGSVDVKPALKDRNIRVMSKSWNKRELDDDGNPTISYSCEPMYLPGDTYALGDNILLIQRELGLSEALRVVKSSYNPYDVSETTFEFANYVNGLASNLYRIVTETVIKDALYNGCRIGPVYGFEAVRNDKMARAYFKSDGLAIQKGDGTGENWVDVLWFDSITNILTILGSLSLQEDITIQNPDGSVFLDEQGLIITRADTARAIFKTDQIALQKYDAENLVWVDMISMDGAGNAIFNGTLSANNITAGTLSLGDDVKMSNDDNSVYIDKDGITVTGGKISVLNHDGSGSIMDAYGIDPKFLDYFKNLVYNSSFEVFDTTTLDPKYWSGGVSDPNSNFHLDYSLKLEAGESCIQTISAAINPDWYQREKTRVAFYRKLGQVKIEIYDHTNSGFFTLTDEEGNTGTSITFDPYINWQGSRVSVSFDPEEVGHDTCVAFRIKFTNVHATDACYIDAVQCHPDFTGKWPQLYKDGPKSAGVGGSLQQIVVSDTEPTDTDVLWFDTSS